MSNNFEDLTHQYHEKYRTTGIALAISLATVASAECLIFYKLYKQFNGTETHIQSVFWIVIIVAALSIFFFSFALQFLHYYGMKEMARSFFYAYKHRLDETDSTLKCKIENKWNKALCYFKNADCCICALKWLFIINFIAVFLYVLIYKPIFPK